jgi:hypothetical protein
MRAGMAKDEGKQGAAADKTWLDFARICLAK